MSDQSRNLFLVEAIVIEARSPRHKFTLALSYFTDSTCIKVCHNRRIKQHQVFNGLAARGKTSVDWFFGFKLHLVVNELGEIVNVQLTPGNTDDRKPVPDLLKGLSGKVFADRGYVSAKLAQQLLQDYDIEFFALAQAQYEE